MLDLLPEETQGRFMDNGNEVEVICQSAVYFKIWQITKTYNSLYPPLPPGYPTFYKVSL